ncbi:hypothetical protein BDZ97DRAFT_1942245 [Flammula alnicola]|nr:hypothetical protein BDZ97DRAFT_1942245 [Flammula alnicola]
MDALRKVYHRAVQIPLDNVERLWQELETFETNLNKITAKKFMADLSPAHMQARTVLRQLINHVTPLYASNSQELFLPSLPKFDASERALVGKWKAYLKWEESNPLEIEDKDKATLITRIQGVYRKAVIRMRYYTEIWYEIALSFIPYFADVHATYEKFLGILQANLETLQQTTNSANTSFSSNVPGQNNGAGNGNAPANMSGGEPGSNNSSFNTQASDERPKKTTELQRDCQIILYVGQLDRHHRLPAQHRCNGGHLP